MNPARSLAPETLLAHRQWVRDLARRLVADPSAAEDLEQQTWLAALRSPPRDGASPRAWLATVLRSWLHKVRRGDERRTRREQCKAPQEPAPATADIVEQAEAHRRVVEAVFQLDEPLRTTVLLRFFEDLPLAEVAARTAVPLETVRSRIRRSLELLRAGLDRQAGGRGAWLAALTPLAQHGAVHAAAQLTAHSALAAIVMNTTHKLMVAAVLLLGGTATFLLTRDPDPPLAAPDAQQAPVALAGPATAPFPAGGERAERSLAEGAAVQVTVLVRTWTDEPIEGALVQACVPPAADSEGGEYDRPEPAVAARATTNAAGSVVFTDLAAGRWHFLAQKQGRCRAGAPDVVLRAGARADTVLIRLGTGHALAGRVLAADGRAVAGATVSVFPTSSALIRPRTTTDGQGRFHFEALRAGPTYVAAALPGGTVSPVETIQIPDVTELDIVLRTGGILTGKVTDPSGHAIAGARVRAQTNHAGYYKSASAEAVTDAGGRYRIDTLGEGLIHDVTVSKEGWIQVPDGMADNFDSHIPFRDGGTWTKDLVLGRGGRLVVTVRGPSGPVAGALVALNQRLRSPARPQAITDASGVATFAAIAPLRTLVAVRAEGMQQPGFPTNWWQLLGDPTARCPFLVEGKDGAAEKLEVALVPAAAIAGRVLGPDDAPLEGAAVSFANASDPSAGARTGADGCFLLSGARTGSVPLSIAKKDYVAVGSTVVEVPAVGATGLVLRMAKAPRVHGTVRAAGARLGETFVQLSMVPDREVGWQEEFRWANSERYAVGAHGAYDVPLPRAEGRFAVRAVALAYPSTTSPPVSIEQGKDSYVIDLELERGHELVGCAVATGTSDGVAGARIRAEWCAPGLDTASHIGGPDAPPVLAVSDRTGRFVLHDLRAGRWLIHAIADSFLAATAEISVPPAGELVLSLPAELSLEGFVRYPDGRPVASAGLMPHPQQGNRDLSIGIDQWTSSGPDGRFKVPRLAAGLYRLDVVAPSTGTANFRRLMTGIVAAGTRDLRIVVEPGALIAGRVGDGDGKALGGVSVSARAANADVYAGVETLADGTFLLGGLEDGASYTVTVNASSGNRSSPYATLQRPYVAAGTTGLEFVLRPGLTIDGVVVDAAGVPMQGVEVTALPVATDDSYGPMGRSEHAGKFEIRGLQPGHYRLAIPQWHAQGLLLSGGDDVAAGATGLRLTATDGAKIRGIVVDELGGTLAGVEVEVVAAQPGVPGGTWTRSRADGGFDLAGLVPDAAYDVSARQRGRVPARQRGVVAGSATLRLVLARGLQVQGRLLDGAGQPLAGTNLRFVQGASESRATTRTGADGSFTVSGMVPGTYTVEASIGTAVRLEMVPCGTVEAGQRSVELRLRR